MVGDRVADHAQQVVVAVSRANLQLVQQLDCSAAQHAKEQAQPMSHIVHAGQEEHNCGFVDFVTLVSYAWRIAEIG